MNKNPYQSPTSELGNEYIFKYSVLWKIYFYFILILTILDFPYLYFIDNIGYMNVFASISMIPVTTGLYGYVFRKRLLKQQYWNTFFYIYLVWLTVYSFVGERNAYEDLDDVEYKIALIIGWTFELPILIALYFYGKKTCPIWLKNTN